ncbi:Acetyltransferase involved in cellulose biosynthesis, CelD/BcsL family [Noviherbaspirillum humi]|uniref:Acetyltransferase involved in cellulose biosynthesis, CelD/BcsL family n=1 Tax=Noviherbaspirillum humi TaxID=1688639 RepID=A0A239HL24_9BURK|nr:GNAT family N-acetyltransferase [Noviherbaspirillum humi]SNS82012.1 Acetyltransferase involved in cellulose biosynthesis, CelD/BcsL family [Noviherbaspirillum humi]
MSTLADIRVYDTLQQLPSPLQALCKDDEATSFFLSHAWFDNLSRTGLDAAMQTRVYAIAAPSGDPLMLLPMCHAKLSARSGTRRLQSLSNYYSSLYAPLATSQAALDALPRLAGFIAAERPRWDIVDFRPLAGDSTLTATLEQALRSAGMAVQRYFCFGNWYLPVEGRTFQQYFDTLPSRLRNTVRRRSNQLAAAHALDIRILQTVEDIDEGIRAYSSVYAASWKQSEPHPDFMPSLIRLCAVRGWLRLGVAYIDGEPAAAQLWIVQNRTASIYKLAYDERFAKLSVGSVLTSRLMQHVIDVDAVAEVDYLTGDEVYKRDWMSHRRERWGVMAYNLRTWRGRLAAALNLGKSAIKRLRRALPLG